jgi:hypothetical protein
MPFLVGAWGVVTGVLLSLLTTAFAEAGPRVSGVTVSVGFLLMLAALPALVLVVARWAGSGWLGLAPWSAWLLGSVVQGTRRPEGDLLLLGDGPGLAVLYGGALIGAVAVGLAASGRLSRRTSSAPPDRPPP